MFLIHWCTCTQTHLKMSHATWVMYNKYFIIILKLTLVTCLTLLTSLATFLVRISSITNVANAKACVIASFTMSICWTLWTGWIYTLSILSTFKVIRAIRVIAACICIWNIYLKLICVHNLCFFSFKAHSMYFPFLGLHLSQLMGTLLWVSYHSILIRVEPFFEIFCSFGHR